MATGEGGTVQQTGEPSVEEILQSIRRVVSGEQAGSAPDWPAADGLGDADEGVLELTNVLEPAPAGADASAEAERAGGDRPMLAPERQAAIRDSLKALAALAAPGAAREVVRSAESSLDGLTRELLRPMMADWLDRNLPPLVEKLLKAEIARIAGRLP